MVAEQKTLIHRRRRREVRMAMGVRELDTGVLNTLDESVYLEVICSIDN